MKKIYVQTIARKKEGCWLPSASNDLYDMYHTRVHVYIIVLYLHVSYSLSLKRLDRGGSSRVAWSRYVGTLRSPT